MTVAISATRPWQWPIKKHSKRTQSTLRWMDLMDTLTAHSGIPVWVSVFINNHTIPPCPPPVYQKLRQGPSLRKHYCMRTTQKLDHLLSCTQFWKPVKVGKTWLKYLIYLNKCEAPIVSPLLTFTKMLKLPYPPFLYPRREHDTPWFQRRRC